MLIKYDVSFDEPFTKNMVKRDHIECCDKEEVEELVQRFFLRKISILRDCYERDNHGNYTSLMSSISVEHEFFLPNYN